MNLLVTNLVLALIWAALMGEVSLVNLIIGFVIAYASMALIAPVTETNVYFQKISQTVNFVFYFLKELILANLQVAYDIITPTHKSRPGIIAVPLDAKTDTEIASFANFITLTPGTLSLDVSDDRKVLFVHVMFVDDPEKFKKEIKEEFEKRLLDMMR